MADAQVFISYARKDLDQARRVIDALTRSGYRVWWDARITPQNPFDAIIEREIKAAFAVLVLWTPNAVESEWVRSEAHFARSQRKLLPLKLADCTVPLAFGQLQTANLTSWNGGGDHPEWRRVLEWIDELSGADISDPSARLEEIPPVRHVDPKPDPRSRMALMAASAALAALLLGAAAYFLVPRLSTGCLSSLPDARQMAAGNVAPVLSGSGCIRQSFGAFRDCETCPQMVVMPPGTFTMGSPADSSQPDEQPAHKVSLERPFAIGRHEISWANWMACVAERGCKLPDVARDSRSPDFPAHLLSWDEANTYTAWLSKRTGARYRLPTEAEWEYAARGDTTTRFSSGHDPASVCATGNVLDQTFARESQRQLKESVKVFQCEDGFRFLAPVGRFRANLFGLHDMQGNVGEHVQDCYQRSYDNASPFGTAFEQPGCKVRVVRGASWFSDENDGTITYRLSRKQEARSDVTGFRVARDIDP